jgi:hypothetical protein
MDELLEEDHLRIRAPGGAILCVVRHPAITGS